MTGPIKIKPDNPFYAFVAYSYGLMTEDEATRVASADHGLVGELPTKKPDGSGKLRPDGKV